MNSIACNGRAPRVARARTCGRLPWLFFGRSRMKMTNVWRAVAVAPLVLAAVYGGLLFSSDTPGGSGSDAGPGNSSGSSSGSSSGGAQTSGGASSCVCSLTYNGVSANIGCGAAQCVNGKTFTCGSAALVTMGGPCDALEQLLVRPEARRVAPPPPAVRRAPRRAATAERRHPKRLLYPVHVQRPIHVHRRLRRQLHGAIKIARPASPPISPGGACAAARAVRRAARSGYVCNAPGATALCCSGQCGAPNGNGLSFCN